MLNGSFVRIYVSNIVGANIVRIPGPGPKNAENRALAWFFEKLYVYLRALYPGRNPRAKGAKALGMRRKTMKHPRRR